MHDYLTCANSNGVVVASGRLMKFTQQQVSALYEIIYSTS